MTSADRPGCVRSTEELEKTKDVIELDSGVRPDLLLDIGADSDWLRATRRGEELSADRSEETPAYLTESARAQERDKGLAE